MFKEGNQDVQLLAKLDTQLLCAKIAYENEIVFVLYRTQFFVGLDMVGYSLFSATTEVDLVSDMNFLQKSCMNIFGSISIYLLEQRLNQAGESAWEYCMRWVAPYADLPLLVPLPWTGNTLLQICLSIKDQMLPFLFLFLKLSVLIAQVGGT